MKKLRLGLLGSVGLLMLVHGCRYMAKDMGEEAALYSRKCSSCHHLIVPNLYDRKTWRQYIEKYGQKLTVEEKHRLLYYLAGSRQE